LCNPFIINQIKKMKKILFLLLCAGLMQACCHKQSGENCAADKKDSVATAQINADHMMLAVLFYQKAAENRALYYQAFNTAKWLVEEDLEDNPKGKRAVVLDIDETVLDNSPYEAQCILGKFGYPEKWEEWCNGAKAESCPGAIDFLKYSVDKGYDIFYITNRKEKLKEGTLKNLKDKGFPMADETHVLFRTEDNSKEGRRQQVAKTYRIALLIGDNLADFLSIYDAKLNPEQRAIKTDSLKAEFGKRFIVLPNPMYGDWEMALYPDAKAAFTVKDSIRRANLKGF
jgi:5'-nucleotidase (lipoprotein e(P4) family)